ncbi:hypothetical protein [Plebeiibacterium sediminum]|uniref:Uncharacterized protein n=1 Tax=Plebeiibacterium sediminum TaxID=2992112 RepID=A0AAE3SI86_9BACT|nr:hypothetical protein [Plebeiobacterium sediminum]MCW3788928.1 hypothetical protein [Plebeiobacterium sediminum]
MMKKIIDNIINPNLITLILYGLLSLVCLVTYVWWFSFVWEFIFSVTHYIIGLLVTLGIGLNISYTIDKKHGTKLKRYILVSLAQLIIIWTVANPIRTWQIESSKNKARLIIESLETYKMQYDNYPTSLAELGNKLNLVLPNRTNIGTKYLYTMYSNKNYSLAFTSYYGYMASYNNEQGEWGFTD